MALIDMNRRKYSVEGEKSSEPLRVRHPRYTVKGAQNIVSSGLDKFGSISRTEAISKSGNLRSYYLRCDLYLYCIISLPLTLFLA